MVSIRTKFRHIGVVTVLALLTGCISTTESVFTDPYSPEKALDARVELARQYIGEGNWEAAKRNLQLAYDIDPKNAYVYEAFALVYQSTGEFELAEENFEMALEINPDFPRARNNYAAFLFSQQRYDAAEEQLELVVKDTLYTGRPRAFVNLGLCRVQLFNPEGAEEAFVRALAMDRTNSIALLEMAELRFNAGDYRNAGQYYGTYNTVVRQQSARALWLGVRLARESGNQNDESSYALALANRYPNSIEFEAYKRTVDQ
jgi:type IV pilus assembly protein PilF